MIGGLAVPASALSGDRLVNPVTGSNVGDCTATKCKTIAYAHSVAVAGNRIVLDAGTYAEKLVITKAITIDGAGAATTFIGGPAVTAGIQVNLNPGANNTVTVNGVTIRSGVGGLFVNTGKGVVNDSVVSGNTGTTVGAGVIVNPAPSEVTLNNTTVSNNVANNGAGIYTLGGRVSMTGGQVVNNTANAVTGNAGTGFGGGIFSASTVAPAGLSLSGVTVSGNKANAVGTQAGSGGGIYNAGTASILNSTITANQANSVGSVVGNGGGIYNGGSASVQGTLDLSGTTITENTATNGGGLLNLNFGAAGTKVTMTGGQVSKNTATAISGVASSGLGGGVYTLSTGALPLTLTGVTVDGNKAVPAGTQNGIGGGIYSGNASLLDTTTVSNNVATIGGGVFNTATATFTKGSVATNQAVANGTAAGNGGGIYNTGTATALGTLKLTDTTITGNTANNGGGLLNINFAAGGTKVTMTGGAVSGNKANAITGNANTGFGGGVYTLSTGALPLTLSGVTLDANQAVPNGTQAGTGGGVYAGNASSLDGATLSHNVASSGGGAYNAAAMTLTGTTFDANQATFGGGINNQAAGVVTATTTSFTNNAASNGAGVYNLGKVTATGGSISDNTVTALGGAGSTGFGGGVYNASSVVPALTLSGVTLARNKALNSTSGTAVLGNAGGILNFGAAVVTDSAFTDNTAEGSGGAIYNFAGTMKVSGTPFNGNAAPGFGGTINDGAPASGGNPSLELTDSPIVATGTTFLGGAISVGSASDLRITGGSITNGRAVSGGGLFVAQTGNDATAQPGGKATLTGTTVSGNVATTGNGGGIFNGGTLTVSAAEIRDNVATAAGNGVGVGAGVYSNSAGTSGQPSPAPAHLSIDRVTLAGNHAQGGSAIAAGGVAAITNSTVTQNVSDITIGAIFTSGATTLSNSTVVGNTAGAGNGSSGGIFRIAGTTTVAGTIVALNGNNCTGAVVDGGYNLSDTAACGFTNNAVIADPQLNALADNGGPTRTVLPKQNSPAINKIPTGPLCPGLDQRGVARPQGSLCDIGSVELEGISAPTLTGPDHALYFVGTPGSTVFTYTGVPTPTFSTTGDPLPAGVTLVDNHDGTATLSGTPQDGTADVYHFTIVASNGETPDATIAFTLTVISPLVVTTTSLPDGEVGVGYNATLNAAGGTAPYTWSVVAGALPAGLTLNPSTGAITGTPTGPEGASNFTVKVVDSTLAGQQSATKDLTISIKTATTLVAAGAIVRVALPSLKIFVVDASATLRKSPGGEPISGQMIRFQAGSQVLCSAVTNAQGVAHCDPTLVTGNVATLLALGYDAYFDGTPTLKPSTGHGALIST